MNQHIKSKWVAALRSGQYKQGRHQLNNRNEEYCCLGVLCEVLELSKRKSEYSGAMEYSATPKIENIWYGTVLPIDVVDKLGLPGMNVFLPETLCNLTQLNDNGTPFEEIATLIETEL